MAKRKILFVGQFAPPVHGVSVMNEYVLHSKLLNKHFDFVKINLTTARSIENIGQPGLGKYLKFTGILLNTLRQLAANKFYLAYLTLSPVGYAFVKDSIIVRLIRFFNVPLVLHLHGKGIDRALTKGGPKTRKQYNKVFAGATVITLSAGLEKDIGQITTYKEIFVVNNGIPANAVRAKAAGKKPIEVLMLSNLIKAKGAFDLLQATRILSAKGLTGFTVVFAGAWGETGFAGEFLSYVTANGLETVVKLPGPVYGAEKEKTLAGAELFVLPTYYANECFPLTILEAMRQGLPVIATPEGAIAEMVVHEKTGLIIPARNPQKLAAAIEKLILDRELRQQMGRAAKARFSNHYTLDIFEKNMLTVFNKINR